MTSTFRVVGGNLLIEDKEVRRLLEQMLVTLLRVKARLEGETNVE